MTNPLTTIQNALSARSSNSTPAASGTTTPLTQTTGAATPPPSHHSNNNNNSLFHKLKKLYNGQVNKSHVHKTMDAEFDVARNNFEKLSETMHQLRSHVNSYIQAVYNVCNSSHSTVLDFNALLTDSTTKHPYSQLVDSMKTGHAQLIGERESALAAELPNHVMKPIESHIEQQRQLKERIAIRLNYVTELDYYTAKVAGLKEDKDKKIAEGKDYSSKENERYDRNIKKLESVKQQYNQFNQELLKDLVAAYKTRISVLGPCINHFARIEKQFLRVYTEAMQNVQIVDENDPAVKAELHAIDQHSQQHCASVTATSAPVVVTQSNDAMSEVQRKELERNLFQTNGSVVSQQPQSQPQGIVIVQADQPNYATQAPQEPNPFMQDAAQQPIQPGQLQQHQQQHQPAQAMMYPQVVQTQPI